MSNDELKPGKPGETVVLEDKKYGIRQEYQYFTPEYVQSLSQRNIRPIHNPTVERYTNEMTDGLFFNDITAPMCYDKDGILVDGQHRAAAILRSGKSYWLPVARNVVGKRHAVVDTGRSRKMWQNLGIPSTHDHALKVIWKYGQGEDKNPAYAELSQDDYMAAYRKFKAVMEKLDAVPPPTGKQAYRKAELLGVAARVLKYNPECEGVVTKALTEL